MSVSILGESSTNIEPVRPSHNREKLNLLHSGGARPLCDGSAPPPGAAPTPPDAAAPASRLLREIGWYHEAAAQDHEREYDGNVTVAFNIWNPRAKDSIGDVMTISDNCCTRRGRVDGRTVRLRCPTLDYRTIAQTPSTFLSLMKDGPRPSSQRRPPARGWTVRQCCTTVPDAT